MTKPAGVTYTPAIYVEFAFGYGALADTTEGSWTNVTTAFPNDLVVDDIEYHRGRPDEFNEFPPGVAKVTFKDRLRKLDPSNASGPYFGNLKPRTPIRIRAVFSAVSYVRFSGYVDGWPLVSSRGQSLVSISATDAFKIFASTVLPNIYDREVLADTPNAYWRLGEATGTRAVDSSTTRADGEYIGSNTARAQTSVVPYGGDGSIETHGTNYEGVVVVDESAKVGSITTGNMSVEMWISAKGVAGTSQRQDLVRQGTGGSYGVGWTFTILPEAYNDLLSSDSWLYQQHCDILVLAMISTPAVYYWRVPGITDDDTINHLVVVVEVAGGVVSGPGAGGVATAYLNGALIPLGVTDAGPSANAAPEIYIGAGALVSENASFEGRVDNVALYRSSLSAARILAHYTAATNPWDNETTGVRIGRVLDLIGWPAALRDIDAGEMLCGPAVLDGQSALEYLQKIARSEQGRLFMSHDGKVTFHQRDRFLTQSTETTSQYNFSDDGAGNAVVEPPTFDYDERHIFNRAVVTRVGGDPQQVDSTSSQATYGAVTRSLTELALRDDRHSRALADYIVYRYAAPQVRVGEWGLQPEVDAAALWAALFALRLGYRVTVENKPSNTGTQIATDMHVESITEKITPATWHVSYGGSPVDPNSANYFTWGKAAVSGWGTDLWR